MNKQIEEMAHELCGMTSSCEVCRLDKLCLWISVEERLPDRTGKYLVFTFDRRIYLGDFVDHYCDGNMQFDDYRVTHWMPLPEAPKMKGDKTDA